VKEGGEMLKYVRWEERIREIGRRGTVIARDTGKGKKRVRGGGGGHL